MTLLANAKAQVTKEAEAPVATTPAVTEAKKKHNNSEYQKRQREKALASANILKALITEKKIELTQEQQDALDFLCRVKKPGTGNGVAGQTSIFEKLFGAEPKVGTVVGAYDMLKKVNKNFSDMNKLIKKWAEDANNPRIVEFNEEKLEYKLVKIGK